MHCRSSIFVIQLRGGGEVSIAYCLHLPNDCFFCFHFPLVAWMFSNTRFFLNRFVPQSTKLEDAAVRAGCGDAVGHFNIVFLFFRVLMHNY